MASANLDHITHFRSHPEGDGLDPGRMDDWLVLLDGMPLVRAAGRLTGTDYPRLAGADLLPALFTLAEKRHSSVAILGGRPEIGEPLAAAMCGRWPDLRVVGHLTPPRAELADRASSLRIQADLVALRPDLLVVALGKPRQERWMTEYARETGARVVVGFGAAIDFIAGAVPRAPKWMQDAGLEWSYRLLRAPRRMARRYLVQGPVALARLRADHEVVPSVDEAAGTFEQVIVPGVTVPVAASTSAVPGQASPTVATVPSQHGPVRRSARSGPSTAVVVTYQSARHVGALLRALRAEQEAGLDLDVLVVDHASTDGTADVVAGFEWARLVPTGGNLGYAAGVNVGGQLAPLEDPLFILNPDLVPNPGALGMMLAALDDRDVGVVVPRTEDADGLLSPSLRNEPSCRRAFVDALLGRRAARLPEGWSGTVWNPQSYEREQFPDWATGAALLVSATCRAAVGEWDERYFLYSEETDYLRRVREAGLRISYAPEAVVRHSGGGSGTSDSLYALCVVNFVRYYRRYHAPLPGVVFGAGVALHEVLRARRPAARLAIRALLSSSVRASLPGSVVPKGGRRG